ncbi:MAG: hypothetical protein JNJ59_08360 [Deltaproteobacteria bacterium]|jgi:hypothetical protein|nr:hypothetical protein [Deltaproteobacteria bacterium]
MGKVEQAGGRGAILLTETLQTAREVAATARKRAEELIAEANLAKSRIARDFWEIGRLLVLLRAEGLVAVCGFESIEDLAEARIGLSKATTWKLQSIAVALPREEATRLGPEKCYAVISLARVAPELGSPEEIVHRDVEVAGRPLSSVTVRELREVIAERRPKPPVRLVDRKQASEDRALLATVRTRFSPLGVPKAAIAVEGDHVVVRLTRAQAAKLS